MTVGDRTRPAFACDKCARPIQPEKRLLLWDHKGKDLTALVCRQCDPGEQLYSQELDTGLIYLLIFSGWLTEDLRPTARLLTAAKKGSDAPGVSGSGNQFKRAHIWRFARMAAALCVGKWRD
jgi:hypothetical protein